MIIPLIAAGIGAAGSIFGASKSADATTSAAAASAQAQVKAAEIAAKNALERQQQLFDLQKEAKRFDIGSFDPMERRLESAFALSPVGQKLSRQQFYNQQALNGALAQRFGAASRFYGA
jgi:hypothetical protein